MSRDPLKSARLKAERGVEHIRVVEAQIIMLHEIKPYVARVEFDPVLNQDLVRLSAVGELPPLLIAATGDAIQNLRSSLDHIAWAVSQKRNSRLPPSQIYFPFFQHENDLLATKNKQKLLAVGGSDWFDFVVQAKPYTGGNDLLRALNQASNIDKHRELISIQNVRAADIAVRGVPLGVPITIRAFEWRSLDEDLTVASVAPGLYTEPDVGMTFDVAFGDVSGVANEPVVETLGKFRDIVTNLIDEAEAALF